MNTSPYIFTSARLGFRNWEARDTQAFVIMNANAAVMKYFPFRLTPQQTQQSIEKFKSQLEENGYTYYAVDILDTGEFIGFIGLSKKDFDSPFTPATDIGWRLKPSVWGKGYATEGAERCLKFAFEDLKLKEIISICPSVNTPSEAVMKKIGMTKVGSFNHPQLHDFPALEECFCYKISQDELKF